MPDNTDHNSVDSVVLNEVDRVENMQAYDTLPPILREQLADYPYNMNAQQLQWALANGWRLNDLYEKIIEVRRQAALGFAVDEKGQEHYV